MDLDAKPVIPAEVMSRQVGNETVLLDLAKGTYFGLDGVGQRIWECLAGGDTLGQVVATIVAEFEVDEARAQRDVVEFVDDLVSRGLLGVP